MTHYRLGQSLYAHTAWTGGDMPNVAPTAGCGSGAFAQPHAAHFATIRNRLYRSQVSVWRDMWGDMPDADTRSIFWSRAIADAYATVRYGDLSLCAASRIQR